MSDSIEQDPSVRPLLRFPSADVFKWLVIQVGTLIAGVFIGNILWLSVGGQWVFGYLVDHYWAGHHASHREMLLHFAVQGIPALILSVMMVMVAIWRKVSLLHLVGFILGMLLISAYLYKNEVYGALYFRP